MTELRVLIVDDEPLARRAIRLLLAEHPDVVVVGESSGGREAIAAIRELRPDLVFLDVQMPEVGAFDVLTALDPAEIPAIVFVTAYDQYAVPAFEVHALDYLLKPFEDERFELALNRARHTLEARSVQRLARRISDLLEEQSKAHAGQPWERPEPARRIAIPADDRVVLISVDKIDWIEAADYYSRIHVGAETHLLRESLTSLEGRLDPARFFRIHRSAIINLDRMRELARGRGGRHFVILKDGTRLRLSRSRRPALLERFHRDR